MTPDIQTTVETILTQIESFDNESREQILFQVGKRLKTKPKSEDSQESKKRKFRITDLGGSGIGVWTDPNADDKTRIEQIDNFLRGEA